MRSILQKFSLPNAQNKSVTWDISLDPQISSHLSRRDMTYLSGSHISSHLSRFIFDMTPPKIESFVEKCCRYREIGKRGSRDGEKLSRQTHPGQSPTPPLHSALPILWVPSGTCNTILSFRTILLRTAQCALNCQRLDRQTRLDETGLIEKAALANLLPLG